MASVALTIMALVGVLALEIVVRMTTGVLLPDATETAVFLSYDILLYLSTLPIALMFFRLHRSFGLPLNLATLLTGATGMVIIVTTRIYGLLFSSDINDATVLKVIHVAVTALGIWLVLLASLSLRSCILPTAYCP